MAARAPLEEVRGGSTQLHAGFAGHRFEVGDPAHAVSSKQLAHASPPSSMNHDEPYVMSDSPIILRGLLLRHHSHR